MRLPALWCLPQGEVRTRLENGRVWIDHADPKVLISSELLSTIACNPSETASLDRRPGVTFVGAVLKLTAVNRTVIYRITSYEAAVHGYIGEWPD
jgi:hypothetical protein